MICMGMIKTVLAITSIVILMLCAFGVTFSHVALLPLGVAFYVASTLV